jgi:hypothetical protein
MELTEDDFMIMYEKESGGVDTTLEHRFEIQFIEYDIIRILDNVPEDAVYPSYHKFLNRFLFFINFKTLFKINKKYP